MHTLRRADEGVGISFRRASATVQVKLQAPVVAILTRASVLSRQHAPHFFFLFLSFLEEGGGEEEELTLADVDTLKCAAVRTLRRRTKAPSFLTEGGSLPRAQGTCIRTSVPAAATWGVSLSCFFFFG